MTLEAKPNQGTADSPPHWVYGLPGSWLASAPPTGAPSLEELCGVDPSITALGARVCIGYGSLEWGLEELMERFRPLPEPGDLEDALDHWEANLIRAAALKRRWRQDVRLVNVSRGVPPAEWLGNLFQLSVKRQPPGTVDLAKTELALRVLLQHRQGLLNAWLDAEHWVDARETMPMEVPFKVDEAVDFRRPMPLGRWLLAVWTGKESGKEERLRMEKRCASLERELAVEREQGERLRRYLLQMERELDHYVAGHERALVLAKQLPELLARARRHLEGKRVEPMGP